MRTIQPSIPQSKALKAAPRWSRGKKSPAYLNRDERTARRWEKEEALPIHRHYHRSRAVVYAYPGELDAWRTSRGSVPRSPATPFWRHPGSSPAFALVLLLSLISVGNGPRFGPSEAKAGDGSGMVVRQVVPTSFDDYYGGPSADGRYVTFVDHETGNVGLRDLSNGEQRLLTDAGPESTEYASHMAAISPDGTRVAFGWRNKDNFDDLRLVNVDGTRLRVLYRNPEFQYIIPRAWLPGGQRIVCNLGVSDGTFKIGLVTVSDGSAKVIKSIDWGYAFGMSVSPDGAFVAYDIPAARDAAQRDVFLLAIDGTREVRLIEHPANDSVLGWTPDGNSVLFTSNRTGSASVWKIGVADGRPTGVPELVRPDAGRMFPIGFSSDGGFYYELHRGMKDVYVAEMDPETGKLTQPPKPATRQSVGANYGGSWSPDGRYLAFVRRGPDDSASVTLGSRVVLQDTEKDSERELSTEMSKMYDVGWAPDGSLITFGGDKKNQEGIYRVNLETGGVDFLVKPRRGTWVVLPEWSPDGETLYFMRHDDSAAAAEKESIIARRMADGTEKTLYSAAHIHSWAASPDGRHALIVSDNKQGERATNVLRMLSIESGEIRELYRVEKPEYFDRVYWSPNGAHALFIKKRTAFGLGSEPRSLWRIPIKGGPAEEMDLSVKGLDHVSFHPDGRQIAFSSGSVEVDVWVMENFLPDQQASK